MYQMIGSAKLDLSNYSGSDEYSDGSVEDIMLEIAMNNIDYTSIPTYQINWPLHYHFSPNRENIISWLPISNEDSVLEIGAGCGAITGALSSSAAYVKCVELSKKRSLINAYRHNTHDNIEIAVTNFNGFTDNRKYDWVTLIGVLEYAETFIGGESPFEEMIGSVKQFLKPQGKLVIAIENKLGLKYWAGCREDHTGGFFDGIQGYTSSSVKTFSRHELQLMLKSSGMSQIDFYYPYPDYKFPSQIFSDKYLPAKDTLTDNMNNLDQGRLYLFDETKAWNQIISAGLFKDLANSFLVICSI